MSELLAMTRAGRYRELERKARELGSRHPNWGFVWKALGVSLQMQGKEALSAMARAAELLPNDAEAHCNLAIALLNAGRIDEALARFRSALAIKPDFADAYAGLGAALRSRGRLGEAAASYRRVLAIQPDSAEAYSNLGDALLELGQIDEALSNCRRALQIKPDLAEAHGNLGNALLALGRVEEAVASYRRALQIRPELAEAHRNLGDALMDLGRLEQAAASYRCALQIGPERAEVRNSLANVLRSLGRFDEALANYRRALELKPDDAEAHNSLGVALRLQGRTAEAEASCRRALEINPSSAASIATLAEAQADRGQFAAAEELFRRAISIQPNLVEAWVGIARVRKMTVSDAAWLAEAQRLASQPQRPREAISLRYAIGKYFDDLQDFEQAFLHYQRANELTKLHASPYDRQRSTQTADQLIHSYDRKWLDQARIHGVASARPVFIVGMPRSGTSLAEQILASHPYVFGAGELMFWSTASATYHSSARNGEVIGSLLHKFAGDYLQLLERLSADALRVVDKMPGNFMFLGLIHAALPEARIIHMRRDPIDTCLSIYFQDFGAVLAYANDLEDLAHYYGEYRRLMSHWQSVLPENAILDVPYEGLVADQEAWSRKMLEFIALPWDPHCLEFHQTRRSVVTTSKWQVRQKISTSSVARWRNYAQHVGPLLPLLQLDPG